jgi:uncharacterized damage-inducible protein DinB
MDIRTLFDYSENARRLLRETLLAQPEAFDRPFETLADYASIRQLVAHIIGAEVRWITQRIGGQAVVRYEERVAESVEGVFADWDGIRATTRAFVDAQDAAGLSRSLPITLGEWRGNLTVEQILFHLINHETHHRAQISMALQQMQIDPPNFDFVLLLAPVE